MYATILLSSLLLSQAGQPAKHLKATKPDDDAPVIVVDPTRRAIKVSAIEPEPKRSKVIPLINKYLAGEGRKGKVLEVKGIETSIGAQYLVPDPDVRGGLYWSPYHPHDVISQWAILAEVEFDTGFDRKEKKDYVFLYNKGEIAGVAWASHYRSGVPTAETARDRARRKQTDEIQDWLMSPKGLPGIP